MPPCILEQHDRLPIIFWRGLEAEAAIERVGFDVDGVRQQRSDAPAGGQLLLIEVSNFHLGLLPNALAGVHEGAVAPASQGNSSRGYSGRSFSS